MRIYSAGGQLVRENIICWWTTSRDITDGGQ